MASQVVKLREKSDEMRKKLEEFEDREKAAIKETARWNEVITKHKNESETLRRSCSLTEYQLDKAEDLLEQKLEKLIFEQKRAEQECSIVKILEDREIELDNDLEKLEPRLKEGLRRRHETEMRLKEAENRLSLTRHELSVIRSRKMAKEDQVRELHNMVKVGGRSIQQLVISEEKFGDKEDEFRYKIKKLQFKITETLMRAEEGERKCRRLEHEKRNLQKEIECCRINYNIIKSDLEETLNGLEDA